MKDFQIEKTAELYDEKYYWQLVKESVRFSTTQFGQEEYLIGRLLHYSPHDLIGFRLLTDRLVHDAHSSELWCAARIMNNGCGDDAFEYFKCWVISRGEEVYKNAVKDPDTLVTEIQVGRRWYEFELFWYAPNNAFKMLTGKDLYSYVDYEKRGSKMDIYPNYYKLEFNWDERDVDSIRAICPNLYAAFSRTD